MSASAVAGNPQALTWLETEARSGQAQALAALGRFYDEGEVVPQNAARALDYYQQAAEAGVPFAQLEMAGRYAAGQGVEQDYVQAHVWANLAAAAGQEGAAAERNVIAQFLSPEELAEAQSRATRWREEQAQND